MRILGIDPGYGITGFGVIDAQRGQTVMNAGLHHLIRNARAGERSGRGQEETGRLAEDGQRFRQRNRRRNAGDAHLPGQQQFAAHQHAAAVGHRAER